MISFLNNVIMDFKWRELSHGMTNAYGMKHYSDSLVWKNFAFDGICHYVVKSQSPFGKCVSENGAKSANCYTLIILNQKCEGLK